MCPRQSDKTLFHSRGREEPFVTRPLFEMVMKMVHSNSEPLADLLTVLSSNASAQRVTNEPPVRPPAVGEANASERTGKNELRIEAYDLIDEANSAIGLARVVTTTQSDCARIDALLLCVQNDLFDLGANLCVLNLNSDAGRDDGCPRIFQWQVDRLERWIDELNADLPPLESLVLPGGSAASASLHLARTLTRRAERLLVVLANARCENVGELTLKYIHYLSYFLFVAARYLNRKGDGDILWDPGQNRSAFHMLTGN